MKTFLRWPKPQSDAELEIVSKVYFGTPLHLNELRAYPGEGFYKVAEEFDSYDSFRHDYGSNDSYNKHRKFWNYVCGPLSCGGVATHSYGQFNLRGHRQLKRLQAWISSRRNNDSSSVREPFARLAERYTGSERTPRSATKGVLIGGREDGALAASSRGAA